MPKRILSDSCREAVEGSPDGASDGSIDGYALWEGGSVGEGPLGGRGGRVGGRPVFATGWSVPFRKKEDGIPPSLLPSPSTGMMSMGSGLGLGGEVPYDDGMLVEGELLMGEGVGDPVGNHIG